MSLEDSLSELSLLAMSANAEVVGSVTQRLNAPTSYYLGKGKLAEVLELKGALNYNILIVDDELSPSQQRNLEETLQVKVIDRTALILDIFARRARTREGRLQVELAQHQYLLPRLTGQWSHLERLGGGIGTRGPGESQLETDRRLVRKKIQRLQKELEEVRQHRVLYRERRKREGIPVVAIVGYTNAGKSTLLNTLTNASVLVEDKPFATLDPVTRRILLPNHQPILLTDTVGFIQKLPTTLVEAFKATLEELEEASLLLHVVDITHPNAREQAQVVVEVLGTLGVESKPRITLLNKLDLLVDEDGKEPPLERLHRAILPEGRIPGVSRPLFISAYKGWGLDRLVAAIASALMGEPEVVNG